MNYSFISKLLHRVALKYNCLKQMQIDFNNLSIANAEPDMLVYVSGLARSGTTKVMNELYNTGSFYTLTYAHFPFVLMPRFWKINSKTEAFKHRPHGDNIYVNSKSPEAFEEVLWQTLLPAAYAHSFLPEQKISKAMRNTYFQYLNSFNKESKFYLTKNNNLILRLASFKEKVKNAKYIFLFRDPISHANSLLRMHQRFTIMQQEEDFVLEYMNYIGHYEFGLSHKPFFKKSGSHYDKHTINYWLYIWNTYYTHLLEIAPPNALYLSFENLTRFPNESLCQISDFIGLETRFENLKPYINFSPSMHVELPNEIAQTYERLLSLQK